MNTLKNGHVDGLYNPPIKITSAPASKWLDTKAAAKYLGVSESQVYKLTSRNEIVYHKVNGKGSNRYLIADLDDFIQNGRVESKSNLESKINSDECSN